MSEEEIKRDAARYRMLRNAGLMSDGRPSIQLNQYQNGIYMGTRPLTPEEADDLCDQYVQKDNG